MVNQITKEKNLSLLYQRRHYLDRERIKLANLLDKYLLLFSTGSLYLSILFTNNIVDYLCKKILGIGWSAFIISMIATLLSIIFSEYAFYKQMNITDEEIRNINDDIETKPRSNPWNKIVEVMRWVGISAFIVGVVSLSFFYFINI